MANRGCTFYRPLKQKELQFVKRFCEIGENNGIKALEEFYPDILHPSDILHKPQIIEAIELASNGDLSPDLQPCSGVEQNMIKVLVKNKLNYSKAAAELGIAYASLTSMMRKPGLKYELSLHMKAAREYAMVDATDLIVELANIAFSDPTQFVDLVGDTIKIKQFSEMQNTAAIKEISSGQYGPTIKLHDKMGALNTLVKVAGMTKEKVEISGKAEIDVNVNTESPIDKITRKLDSIRNNKVIDVEVEPSESDD